MGVFPKIAFVVATWQDSFVLSDVFCINPFPAHPGTRLPRITSPASFPLASLAQQALICCLCHFVTICVTLFPFFPGRLVILAISAAMLAPGVAPCAGCPAAGVLMAQTPHSVLLGDDEWHRLYLGNAVGHTGPCHLCHIPCPCWWHQPSRVDSGWRVQVVSEPVSAAGDCAV